MKTWFEKYYGYPAPVATKQEVIPVVEKEYRKPGPKLGSKRKVIIEVEKPIVKKIKRAGPRIKGVFGQKRGFEYLRNIRKTA